MTKPSSCDKCPAVEKSGHSIQCGCMRTMTASIDNQEEKQMMWENCPLGWERSDNVKTNDN